MAKTPTPLKNCPDPIPRSADAKRVLARALRDDLSVLFSSEAISDDGTDDQYCPWFAVLVHGVEIIVEFSPEGFTLRTYDGSVVFALGAWDYTPQQVLTWFTALTQAAGRPLIIH